MRLLKVAESSPQSGRCVSSKWPNRLPKVAGRLPKVATGSPVSGWLRSSKFSALFSILCSLSFRSAWVVSPKWPPLRPGYQPAVGWEDPATPWRLGELFPRVPQQNLCEHFGEQLRSYALSQHLPRTREIDQDEPRWDDRISHVRHNPMTGPSFGTPCWSMTMRAARGSNFPSSTYSAWLTR